MAGLLWEHWLSDSQKRVIEYYLDDVSKGNGKNVVKFMAAIHDLGKATPTFQKIKSRTASRDLDDILIEKLEKAGFTDISSVNLAYPHKTKHNIASQALLSSYGVSREISTIIGAHHGKPIDSDEDYLEQLYAYDINLYQSEDKESYIRKKWEAEQKNIFEWAMKENGFNDVEELPKIKQPAQVLLSGLLIMADWIASNDDFFPLLDINEYEVENKKDRLKNGFEKWKRSSNWKPDSNELKKIDDIYKNRFGFSPRNFQAILSDIIKNTVDPGIFIIEAPMGLGKTEAALIATEQLAYITGCSGLFFGLPTQATSNGIFPRIVDWISRMKNSLNEQNKLNSRKNFSLRLVHGKANLNDDFLSLANGINDDDKENGSIIVNQWFSGKKKTFLDDFVIGTIDQLLMMALKQRHLSLRHLGFSKKVVIIDEVHAYDTYMNQYLLEALKWMGAYKMPVIILSATLPIDRRYELVQSYMMGRGKQLKDIKERKRRREELKNKLNTSSYPLITYSDGESINLESGFTPLKDTVVKVKKISEENLEQLVEKIIEDGGVLGIIVNTVKKSQELAKIFVDKYGEDTVELLHSGFISTHRIEKEKNLINMIGKNSPRPNKKIIIGTQVIEQSLDIDFDVMISELAPMDLIIQRIGRLHRHRDREKHPSHSRPVLYLLGTSDEYVFDKGSSYVYGDYILSLTQLFLPEHLSIPNDISRLVQNVYGFEINSLSKYECEELCLDYKYVELIKKYKKEYDNIIESKKSKSKDYKLSDPMFKPQAVKHDDLVGWLSNNYTGESEEKSYAQVRDIEESIEIIALKKCGNGYTFFGKNNNISSYILDSQIAKEVARETLVLPKIFAKECTIDKIIEFLEDYRERNLPDWEESIWLKGSLGIIFDENNEYVLNDVKIIYDEKYGVYIERK